MFIGISATLCYTEYDRVSLFLRGHHKFHNAKVYNQGKPSDLGRHLENRFMSFTNIFEEQMIVIILNFHNLFGQFHPEGKRQNVLWCS